MRNTVRSSPQGENKSVFVKYFTATLEFFEENFVYISALTVSSYYLYNSASEIRVRPIVSIMSGQKQN